MGFSCPPSTSLGGPRGVRLLLLYCRSTLCVLKRTFTYFNIYDYKAADFTTLILVCCLDYLDGFLPQIACWVVYQLTSQTHTDVLEACGVQDLRLKYTTRPIPLVLLGDLLGGYFGLILRAKHFCIANRQTLITVGSQEQRVPDTQLSVNRKRGRFCVNPKRLLPLQ
jgi:hypothetical protein